MLLLNRFEPIKTVYNRDLRCMTGNRNFVSKKLWVWVANGESPRPEQYILDLWLPGIGKNVGSSFDLCKAPQLAGAFSCRRDDLNLSEPRSILPTLIHTLAGIFPLLSSKVANRLRNNPSPTADSMKELLVLDFFHTLPHSSNHFLVFLIDKFD